jgi:hypothetical protein
MDEACLRRDELQRTERQGAQSVRGKGWTGSNDRAFKWQRVGIRMLTSVMVNGSDVGCGRDDDNDGDDNGG